MTKNELQDKGFISFKVAVPKHLKEYALNYSIPKSKDRLPDQIELDHRYVDENFKYLKELKDLIANKIKDSQLSRLILSTPEVIVQELLPETILNWHHDAYTFEDGKPLLFEALLYISTKEKPQRALLWKEYKGQQSGTIEIEDGTVILIDCSTDKYLHAAIGPASDERVVTLLLGCR